MSDPAPIFANLPRVLEEALAPGELNVRLRGARQPFVVRGVASDWPLVSAGLQGTSVARSYLVQHRRDRTFPVNIGPPDGDDRLFYDRDMGMNFRMAHEPLETIFDDIGANEDKPDPPMIYLSSIDIGDYFDGLGEANSLPLGDRNPIASIWIGSRSRISAHNDVPDNLAVCAVGRRRFTLFPPEQFSNLYLGPLENTPAGRPVSMVDFHAPDFDAFPRFREALDQAQVAELEPGDAIFVPSLWWHHVEGLDAFNVLVNYWWRDVPGFLGKPEDALFHAVLSLRDLPAEEKAHWRSLFDHYVFANGADVTAHLPLRAQGILAPLTAQTAGQIRAKLLRGLSR